MKLLSTSPSECCPKRDFSEVTIKMMWCGVTPFRFIGSKLRQLMWKKFTFTIDGLLQTFDVLEESDILLRCSCHVLWSIRLHWMTIDGFCLRYWGKTIMQLFPKQILSKSRSKMCQKTEAQLPRLFSLAIMRSTSICTSKNFDAKTLVQFPLPQHKKDVQN